MTRVLVLNASFEPVNVTTVRRAVVLVLKEKAEVVEKSDVPLRAETLTMSCPAVIRLVTYVVIPRTARKRITRRAVFARDGWECLYCGSTSNLTIDHVVPRARGGKHAWENVVTSCQSCNQRKGDAFPKQVGMKLRQRPKRPPRMVFVYVTGRRTPASWAPYLEHDV